MARHSASDRAEHAGRIEGLQRRQHVADEPRGAEPGGELVEVGREIAGLVDEIDEMAADEALDMAFQPKRELLLEVAFQRHLARDERLQIGILVGEVAAARAQEAHPEPPRSEVTSAEEASGKTFSISVSKVPVGSALALARSSQDSALATAGSGGAAPASSGPATGGSASRSSSGLRSSSASTNCSTAAGGGSPAAAAGS